MGKVFAKVKCKGYAERINDGVHIEHIDSKFSEDGKDGWIAYKNSVELIDLSSCEGDCVEKVYYEDKEQEFEGVLVGFRDVTFRGQIGTDYDDNPYRGNEYCFKNKTDVRRCAIVYYASGKKRYVPEYMISEYESIFDE